MTVTSSLVTLNDTTPILLAEAGERGEATVYITCPTLNTSGHFYFGGSGVSPTTAAPQNPAIGSPITLYPGDSLYVCEDSGEATHGVLGVCVFGG